MLSHVRLCDPMGCSLPGSSVHGIFQARLLEWVAFPPPRDLLDPKIEPVSPALAGGFFTTELPGKRELVYKIVEGAGDVGVLR